MMDRKGFVKTIEVLIAIVMSFIFLVLIMPADQSYAYKKTLGILPAFEDNQQFRGCVLDENEGCLADLIGPQVPPYLEYKILIMSKIKPIK